MYRILTPVADTINLPPDCTANSVVACAGWEKESVETWELPQSSLARRH